MLLPPSMQDKTEFMPLGKAIQKPEPVKADPVREFEKHNHDIPGAPRLPLVTPEMAARALRSLCGAESVAIKNPASGTITIKAEWTPWQREDIVSNTTSINREYPEPWESVIQKHAAKQAERLDKLSELSKPPALTWPTLPDLPEPTFLPEVVNEAPSRDTEPLGDLAEKIKEAEERARVGSMVLQVQRRLDIFGFARVNTADMDSMLEWFGPLGIPNNWLGKISFSSDFQRMSSGCPSDQP